LFDRFSFNYLVIFWGQFCCRRLQELCKRIVLYGTNNLQ
jgi:hypothetical protein